MKNTAKLKNIFAHIFFWNIIMIVLDIIVMFFLPDNDHGIVFLIFFIFIGNIIIFAVTATILFIYFLRYFIKKKNYKAILIMLAGFSTILIIFIYKIFLRQ